MNDPVRLLDGEASDRERALLQAAAADEPPRGGEQRLALSLGLVGYQPGTVPGATTSSVGKAALGKSILVASSKWLVLVGIGAGVWLAARPPVAAPRSATRATPQEATRAVADTPPAMTSERMEGSLALEVAALDRARATLARADQRAALALLADYERAHPRGVLRQEATLLRIEALLAAHDDDSARRVAMTFLHEHPASPHRKRVQALLERVGPARAR